MWIEVVIIDRKARKEYFSFAFPRFACMAQVSTHFTSKCSCFGESSSCAGWRRESWNLLSFSFRF